MAAKHNDLCKEIRLYLSSVGILSIDTPTPGLLFTKDQRPVKSTGKGKLDIHACAPLTLYDRQGSPRTIGVYIAIDAKVGKDRLHTDQLKYSQAVHRHGGLAFAAYSVDDVRKTLIKEGMIEDDRPTPNPEDDARGD